MIRTRFDEPTVQQQLLVLAGHRFQVIQILDRLARTGFLAA
jgi:hypothetical protein